MRNLILIVAAAVVLVGCKEAAQCPAADAGQAQDAVSLPDVATAVDGSAVDAADAVTAAEIATPVDVYGDATED